MKKRIKKTLALLTLTVAVFGTSMTSYAASCQNVRDYGHHRYTERPYTVVRAREVLYGTTKEVHYRVHEYYYAVCSDSLCGAHGETGNAWVDRYVKNN